VRKNIKLSWGIALIAASAVNQSQAVADPRETKPKSVGQLPFSCFGSQMDDHLADVVAKRPTYNVHDALGLPSWLNLSIEHRTRYEVLDGQFRAGASGGDQQIPLQTCVFLEANFQPFRIGVEFLDAREYGADDGSTLNNTHVNEADFLQIYGAWSDEDVLGTGLGMEVKAGRQTLNLGSRRLVARNVFRNTVNAFTGVTFRLRGDEGKWQLRAFATQPVERLPNDQADLLDGVHDFDEEEYRTYFSGLFFEASDLIWGINGEAYLFHLHEEDRPSGATANRRLFTPGVRVYRKPSKGRWDMQVETVAQVGESRATTGRNDRRDLSHEAWYQHADLGYTFDVPWSPRFMIQYDYATGDENPNDGKNQRFDTLYGARRFEFGPTGIFGAFARSNINSPGYRLFVNPRSDVSAFVSHRMFWLASDKDQWTPARLQDRTGRSGDFIGHLVEVSVRWDALSDVSFESGWARLIKGEFAKDAPNAPDPEDVDYFYVQTLLRF
jgi:hypothetical protein